MKYSLFGYPNQRKNLYLPYPTGAWNNVLQYNLWSNHRYLVSRFTLQDFFLCRHELSSAPPFILWWPNLEILHVPHHRSYFIGGLRCQPIYKEHSLYIAERTRKAVTIVRCLWVKHREKHFYESWYVANFYTSMFWCHIVFMQLSLCVKNWCDSGSYLWFYFN
jgi:hypothetical protein